jgi:GT2 family glycosyltransferase
MIPILIVCYMRPDKLRNILEVLKNSEAEIYIFIDRAVGINAELNSQVNDVAMSFASSQNIRVRWSNESYGVARGVPAAIEWAFSHVDELVVLEDDCLPSEHAINFFQNQIALINNSVVMSCATSPWRDKRSEKVIGLSSYPLIWGWSTNKVAWMKISRLLGREVPYLRILKTVIRHPSRSLAICYFSAAVIRIRLKKLAAWDCAIALEMLLSNYCC